MREMIDDLPPGAKKLGALSQDDRTFGSMYGDSAAAEIDA